MRIPFGHLPVGTSFFDIMESGEFWTKTGETTAEINSGGFEGIDTFDPSEEVEVL
jgi:hypothetical protein